MPKHKTPISAAGYVRMSTDRQDKSIANQKAEITKYASQHGYTIVRWYADEAISGDATEKRKGFLDMHRTACNGRDFDVIICWDQDRFGRFDSLEAGFYIKPLRDAGVSLVTLNDGPIDWEDFTGRIMYSIKQEGKHQFLRDLSRNTVRGQIKAAERGVHSAATPYGYERMLIDEQGTQKTRVRRGEKVPKPHGWSSKLVLGDPAAVEAIRWMFKTYTSEVVSLRALALRLNERDVDNPAYREGDESTRKAWTGDMVRSILHNQVYTGDAVTGGRSTGKYYHAVGTDIKQTSRNPRNRVRLHERKDQIIVPDAHEALIDRETFERAVERFAENRRRTGARTEDDPFMLTGLCTCGHCGLTMHGQTSRNKPRAIEYTYRRYVCQTYTKRPSDGGCGHHAIAESVLLPVILDKLRDQIFGSGSKEALRERIRAKLAGDESPNGAASRKALQGKLDKADADIKRAARRLLLCDDDVADLMGKELAEMKSDRERIAERLSAIAEPPSPAALPDVDAITNRLWSLSKDFKKAKPELLRELMRRCVSKIELFFEKVEKGQGSRIEFKSGTVQLRPDASIAGLAGDENMC